MSPLDNRRGGGGRDRLPRRSRSRSRDSRKMDVDDEKTAPREKGKEVEGVRGNSGPVELKIKGQAEVERRRSKWEEEEKVSPSLPILQ